MGPSWRLRAAAPSDTARAIEIVFSSLRAFGIEPEPDGLDEDVMRFGAGGDPALDEIVLDLDGRVVGLVALCARPDHVGYLSKLFVDAAERKRGFGRALLQGAIERGRQRGYLRLELRTRAIFTQAVALYESAGWRRGPDPPAGIGPDRTYFIELA
jgi:GNAT superfamily N-acetyltransferase